MLRLNNLITICDYNLQLVNLQIFSPLRIESENKIKINQNNSIIIRVILYISNIGIIKKCFNLSLLNSKKFVIICILYMLYKILVYFRG